MCKNFLWKGKNFPKYYDCNTNLREIAEEYTIYLFC